MVHECSLQSLISTKARLVIAPSGSDSADDSIVCSDAVCIEVPTDDIRVGDSVLVLPGETIPVDVSDLSLFLFNSNFDASASVLYYSKTTSSDFFFRFNYLPNFSNLNAIPTPIIS